MDDGLAGASTCGISVCPKWGPTEAKLETFDNPANDVGSNSNQRGPEISLHKSPDDSAGGLLPGTVSGGLLPGTVSSAPHGYKMQLAAADTTGDGIIDTVGYDTTGDGRIDWIEYDTTGDGEADTVAVDHNGDGQTDAVYRIN